jgi:hypothetical protein
MTAQFGSKSRVVLLKLVGGALIVAGIFFMSVFTAVAIQGGALWIFLLGAIGLGTFACYAGGMIYNLGRRVEVATVPPVNDTRPPVIYLRSFKDDARTSQTGLGEGVVSLPTEEEELVKVLSAIGPVLAVGKPGEHWPRLGARRIYVPNEQWKERVTELMRDAALVVLRPGRTSSIRWEISEAMAHVRPERLLLVLPFDETEYSAFRQDLRETCGVALPLPYKAKRTLPGSIRGFVYFDPDRSSRLVTIHRRLHNTYRKGIPGGPLVPYYSSALSPVLVRCGVEQPPISVLTVGFDVLAGMVLIGLAGYLVTKVMFEGWAWVGLLGLLGSLIAILMFKSL